ncbi:TetR/AcrR family transcriptional regulator [Conexibacter sp. JD483]|uniref:TetR/AcrR family transcriptional regulator n=1 Tax=unclassified Conexibacter TaxID=2627773 RepID=UPI0027216A37|nr:MULTISPECIES: TetR/AcrR family transcriptional regulator [unclassified Conexibacter]MDO8186254.1 TetR/AcrR family transcriptional regulator [Conexibacter sp. CPCC 205706]MDO8199679.1 TetR/AcrR family transcriptional regulator [Conexibacter sp. CPCC 205762]MDR9372491.1 TetR/AcrR family transcriptional regulator [Conexibacter sp. JD483]
MATVSRTARGPAAAGASGPEGASDARRAYHHGDLREALVEATFALIAEKGVHAFSVAEAARRTGVSAAAPYRHFADRDELLAEAATRAAEELRGRFAVALAGGGTPTDGIAAAARAYVRFAAERRAMFEVLFGAGLDKSRFPRLETATHALLDDLVEATRPLVPARDPDAAAALVLAMGGLAQGHATLLLDHAFGAGDDVVEQALVRVEAATRALVRGRSVLFAELAGGGVTTTIETAADC